MNVQTRSKTERRWTPFLLEVDASSSASQKKRRRSIYGLDTEAVRSDTLSTAINPSHPTAVAQRKARLGSGALANLPEYVAPLIFVAALSVYFLLSAP